MNQAIIMSSISNQLISFLHQKPKSLNHLKQLHALLITTNLKSPSILAKLIHHYFLLSPHQPPPQPHLILNHQPHYQLFLLNTLIKCSSPKNSLLLFAKWVSNSSIIFDDYTFVFALGACARSPSLSALEEGRQVHCRAIKHGFMLNLLVATTTIHFYGSNCRMLFARKVFDEMLERSYATWNALIKGYSSQKSESFANSVNALLSFKDMLVDGDKNVKPNGMTMVCVFSAVSRLGNVEVGISVHGFVVKIIDNPENDVFVGTSLVDMYSKCGCLGTAWKVFGAMRVRNVLTWTAMLTGFAFHGKGKEAMELLSEMRKCNVRPNLVTFTSMLSACCHAGLVEEGVKLFHDMEEFGVVSQIEHYGCVVDLLGKAGHLKEAYGFILDTNKESNPVLWRSLLGSCRLHGDVVMGEKVGMILLQLQPSIGGLGDGISPTKDYVALSNLYALAKRWEDVGMIRGEMRSKGLEIKPGRSAVH